MTAMTYHAAGYGITVTLERTERGAWLLTQLDTDAGELIERTVFAGDETARAMARFDLIVHHLAPVEDLDAGPAASPVECPACSEIELPQAGGECRACHRITLF